MLQEIKETIGWVVGGTVGLAVIVGIMWACQFA